MNPAELDEAYTCLCQRLTAAGEDRAILVLGKFALLAIMEIGDSKKVHSMIERASQNAPAK